MISYAQLHILSTHLTIFAYLLMKGRSNKGHLHTHQLGPRYEGQLMSDGGAYSPFRSILLVLTHGLIITCVYRPTGSDEHERKDAGAALRPIFVPFETKGVLYAWGSVQPVNGPPTRTTSVRLVIHRQTSAHERRRWTLSRAPHFRRAPRGGCCSGERSLRSCTPSFELGTTKP